MAIASVHSPKPGKVKLAWKPNYSWLLVKIFIVVKVFEMKHQQRRKKDLLNEELFARVLAKKRVNYGWVVGEAF